jgi:hypothetical protein
MDERRNLAMYAKAVLPSLVIAGGLLALMAAALAKHIAAGDWWRAAPMIIGLGFAACLVVVVLFWQRSRVRKLFLAPSPDVAVRFIERAHTNMARLPTTPSGHIEASAAAQLGLVYAFYGEFDRVRAVLRQVTWDDLPPGLGAVQPGLQSVLAFLEACDPMEALSLARRANRMSLVPSATPLAGWASSAWDLYIKAGEALVGSEEQARDAVAVLERYARRGLGLGQPMVHWALALAHLRLGARERSKAHEAQLRDLAPYCRGLQSSFDQLAGEMASPAA